jgi:His-Xaa-Ser repeat protein HxsA
MPAPAPAVAGTTGPGAIGAPLQPGNTTLSTTQPAMTLEEKRKLQIIRVQVKLTSLRLYDGQMNGVLDQNTKQSIKLFQRVKGLPESGLMTTPTLNALNVPAVN